MELPGYKILILAFGILPMIIATLWGVFDFWAFQDWSVVNKLYTGARDVGRTFLVWDMGNWDTANNKTESLLFDTTPDSVWISLGLLRILGKVAANLQDFAMRNLLLAISLSLIKRLEVLLSCQKNIYWNQQGVLWFGEIHTHDQHVDVNVFYVNNCDEAANGNYICLVYVRYHDGDSLLCFWNNDQWRG